MRESIRPQFEQELVSAALTVLAVATRDTSIDAGVMRVYMPHLDKYTIEEIEGACESLHEADWFPKVGELLKACSKERRRLQDAAADRMLAEATLTYIEPISQEKFEELMARIKASTRSRRSGTGDDDAR